MQWQFAWKLGVFRYSSIFVIRRSAVHSSHEELWSLSSHCSTHRGFSSELTPCLPWTDAVRRRIPIVDPDKKLSYCRGTARRAVSVDTVRNVPQILVKLHLVNPETDDWVVLNETRHITPVVIIIYRHYKQFTLWSAVVRCDSQSVKPLRRYRGFCDFQDVLC